MGVGRGIKDDRSIGLAPRRDDERTTALYRRLKLLGPMRLPLTYLQFVLVQELVWATRGGPGRGVYEKASLVRGKKMVGQVAAEYGGMLEAFIDRDVATRMRLGKDDRFVDVGSGIGNVVIQIALTVNCASVGIEFHGGRAAAANQLKEDFEHVLRKVRRCPTWKPSPSHVQAHQPPTSPVPSPSCHCARLACRPTTSRVSRRLSICGKRTCAATTSLRPSWTPQPCFSTT